MTKNRWPSIALGTAKPRSSSSAAVWWRMHSSDDETAEPPPVPEAKRQRTSTITTLDAAKILGLHIRAHVPQFDRASPNVNLQHLGILPHVVAGGEWLVDARKFVRITLQLKTWDGGNSVGLEAQGILHRARLKLALVPEEDAQKCFVTKRFPSNMPLTLYTSQSDHFSGDTDVSGSFATAEIDRNGFCRFEFKVLLLNALIKNRPPKARFRLIASPLDRSLMSPQLSWKSMPFRVKSQIR